MPVYLPTNLLVLLVAERQQDCAARHIRKPRSVMSPAWRLHAPVRSSTSAPLPASWDREDPLASASRWQQVGCPARAAAAACPQPHRSAGSFG
eukprot:4081748-Prymnesium_polylepis.1